jgi:hypothetical protein
MTQDQFGGDVEAMADEPPEGDAVAELEAAASDGSEPGATTGVQVVDDVLGTLEGLADQPVEQHLPIFEAAHEQLRGALDDPGTADGTEPESQSD